jgi:hypothetical protein
MWRPGVICFASPASMVVATAAAACQYDLEVPDFSRGPLSMSGLALASSAALARPTTGSDKTWHDRFAQPPTTARVFNEGDDIFVAGEIYRNDRQVDAIDVRTIVRRVAGEEVFRRQPR